MAKETENFVIEEKNTGIVDGISIRNMIYVIRGRQVMLDSDLAMLYQVETGRLNEAAKRNIARFPERYRFQLTNDEYENLISQFAISSLKQELGRHGGRRKLPFVYNEQGLFEF